MNKYYMYIFLLVYVIINSVFRDNSINLIYGMPIDFSTTDLILYLPFIMTFIFYISGMYTKYLKEYGYLKIIKYKSRVKWVNFISKEFVLKSFEYTVVLNIIVLIFNEPELQIFEYLKAILLFFIALYILSLLLVLLEYVYGSGISLLIVIGYLSFTIPYIHYKLSNGENLGIIKYFFISTYLEVSIRDMFNDNYYMYLICTLLIIGILYIIILKIFNKKEII